MRIDVGRSCSACRWVILASTLLAGPCRAQIGIRYGYGYGYGFGYGYGRYRPNWHPAEVNFLNQRALLNASRAIPISPPRGDQPERANAYYHHLREPGYLDGIGVGARREIEARIGRSSDGPPPSRLARHARGIVAPRRPDGGRVLPSPQGETERPDLPPVPKPNR